MIQESLSHLHWSVLPVVSMFLFLSVFIGVLIWVFRKESNGIYKQMGELPLEENNHGAKL